MKKLLLLAVSLLALSGCKENGNSSSAQVYSYESKKSHHYTLVVPLIDGVERAEAEVMARTRAAEIADGLGYPYFKVKKIEDVSMLTSRNSNNDADKQFEPNLYNSLIRREGCGPDCLMSKRHSTLHREKALRLHVEMLEAKIHGKDVYSAEEVLK